MNDATRRDGRIPKRKIEAIRSLKLPSDALGELLDEILAEHPARSDGDDTETHAPPVAQSAQQHRLAVLDQPQPAPPLPPPPDRQIATAGAWSVASDGVQWILQRRKGVDQRTGLAVWAGVSFVRSTKDILARCMKERGTPPEDAERLLAAVGGRFSDDRAPSIIPEEKIEPQPDAGGEA